MIHLFADFVAARIFGHDAFFFINFIQYSMATFRCNIKYIQQYACTKLRCFQRSRVFFLENCGGPRSLINMPGGNQGNIREVYLLEMLGTLYTY